ncbi:MAG: hypothetical protein JWM19_1320 [Actinomycetia bacterium]|nr:hypothetical protein [Actinomycetes bacterium]
MKRLCGTVLYMEATLVALCIVPAIALEHVSGTVAGGVGGGIAIAAILLAGFIGKRKWALYAGSTLQLVVIASGVVLPVMYVLGVIFAALWFGGIRLARKWESAAAPSAPLSEG